MTGSPKPRVRLTSPLRVEERLMEAEYSARRVAYRPWLWR